MKLTKRQKEILDFITSFIESEGYSPSMEEIAAHFGFASLNAVFKHLEALEARGYLHRDPNRARSIGLPKPETPGTRLLPLFGTVAAGRPIEAVSGVETMTVPEDLLPVGGSCYVLRVKGDSMIEDHIADGDFVVVESREQAADGEMVVALLQGENVTLKRLYRDGSRVKLQPANESMPPMTFDADQVRVQGVVVAVMRKYR